MDDGDSDVCRQWPLEASGDDGLTAMWEAVIDATDVLRRVGVTAIRRNDSVTEVICEVEYGPVRATEGDLHRHLDRQLAAVYQGVGAKGYAVFNVVPTELSTPEAFDRVIANLDGRATDIDVPLGTRKQLAAVVVRLRSGKNAGRVRRVA